MFALAKWQLGNPVEIDLMRGIEVRDSPARLWGEGIDKAAAGSAAVVGQARCSGSNVDGFGISIVEVELQAGAHLFSEADLEGVVVRPADGTPAVHAGGLIVQRCAGAEATGPAVGAAKPGDGVPTVETLSVSVFIAPVQSVTVRSTV